MTLDPLHQLRKLNNVGDYDALKVDFTFSAV
eukprot:CAMPEP_0185724554 /NCGR_PEP_ID=MMETSP1171-20130828/1007_1 /TAXON_ID=374046 /ORGANISM="Helicotheca tamensis, Strain CCMP826" /LENGTH=30 /DNA_ID= /DNA_START= /DNA_END= /DNA_ORIENTATION=